MQPPVKYFIRYWPGTEHLPLPPHPGLLAKEPAVFRLGLDTNRAEVRAACARAMAMLRSGFDVRLFLPFYAARFVPAHLQRYLQDGPRPGKPEKPFRFPELARACRDARGNYYPALYANASEQMEHGQALMPALLQAYRQWAPDLLAGLQELATDHQTMLTGRQLVRDWEQHGLLVKKTDYFKTGREMLTFAEAFGVIKREGRGRLKWGPLYANVFSYLTSSACF